MFFEALDRIWFSAPGRGARSVAAEAAGVVAPVWCVGCRAEGQDICVDCAEDLRQLTKHPFRAEGPAQALPLIRRNRTLTVLPVFSAGSYRTLLADAVVAFKDHERTGLVRLLAPALRHAVTAAVDGLLPTSASLLIWPPASPSAQLRRGRRPLEELLEASDLPGQLHPAPGLLRHRRLALADLIGSHSGQKTRTAQGRRREARSTLMLAPGAEQVVAGQDVLLVDDVLTTGATLHSLYTLLDTAGARIRGAAVLAASPGTTGDLFIEQQ